MSNLTIKSIEQSIYFFRGQKVMIDSDLAKLYSVETSALNRQVKRNLQRFPDDFMFQLTVEEFNSLICQIGISKKGRGGRRMLPYVFTENGVAMLSTVLNSERAIQVNISIMRIFTKLRSFLLLEKEFGNRLDQLEKGTSKMFKIVFERLDDVDEKMNPALPPNRKKIGLK